jgi:hypothetical protein
MLQRQALRWCLTSTFSAHGVLSPISVPSPGPPAGTLSIKSCPRGWEAGGAPFLPLSKTWAVTVLLFMSPPCPMSGLEGAQPGPAVWPYLSHVIRCLVATDPSAIWLSGLGVRGGRQQHLLQPQVCSVGEIEGFQSCCAKPRRAKQNQKLMS